MPIPCILLTGFLGSGKTTFLNWILQTHQDKKISVILNEFGDIKLESNFVKQHTEEIVELANGCMCCVAKADLPRVINYILDRSPDTQYLLIEASGLSDPDPIHDSFADPVIREKVYLNSILCLVDVLNFETHRQEHKIVMNQIADCDTIILSKISLAPTNQLASVKNYLVNLLPHTQILEFTDSLDPHLFLFTNLKPETGKPGADHEHTHEPYQTWWYLPEKLVDPDILKSALANLPDSVLRAKGYFKDPQGNKYLLQLVGKQIEITKSEWVAGENPKSALLFIGKELDNQTLKQLLDKSLFDSET